MDQEIVQLRMAEMAVVENGTKVKATLGSCVGIILHDKSAKRTALAHIMLPTRLRSDSSVAKYVDTAIPALLEELARRGSKKQNLEAYLAGGAHLFGKSEDKKLATVGEQNLGMTRELLVSHGIAVVQEDTGGERGRTILFDNQTAKLDVKTLNPPLFKRSEQ